MNWLELLERVVVASKLVINKLFLKEDGQGVSFAYLLYPHPLVTFSASSPVYHSIQSRKSSVQIYLGS